MELLKDVVDILWKHKCIDHSISGCIVLVLYFIFDIYILQEYNPRLSDDTYMV